MRIEARIFYLLTPFFLIVGLAYGMITEWKEWVGMLAIPVVGLMAGMIGFYFQSTVRSLGAGRPEDRLDAEIHEGSGEQGLFSPWSWWPILLAFAAAGAVLGLAIGWWIFYISAGLALVGLIGWVFEYSTGDHAH